MFRRGRRTVPAPEHFAGDGGRDPTEDDGPDGLGGDPNAARAESLRADLAGIAARIGGLSGIAPNMPPSVEPSFESVPSEVISRLDRLALMMDPGMETVEQLRRSWDDIAEDLTAWRVDRNEEIGGAVEAAVARFETTAADSDERHRRHLTERLDRLESMVGPGVETVQDLRRSWDELILQAAASNAERGEELERAVAAVASRFEVLLANVDKRQYRQLTEFTELGQERLAGLSSTLDVIGTRLDDLTAIAQQTPAAIERLRSDQARIGAESTQGVTTALEGLIRQAKEQSIGTMIDALDGRIRQSTEQMTGEVVARLDHLSSMTGQAVETMHDLSHGWDAIIEQLTSLAGARGEVLARAIEASSGHVEAMIADLDRRHYRHLVDFSNHGDGRMTEFSAVLDTVGSRLDRVTREQDQLGANLTTAVAAMTETVGALRQMHDVQQAPSAETFEHMSRLGHELEGASERLRETSQQIAQDSQDRRAQMATLELGLRVALNGMEAVVSGRQSEPVAQLTDAQRGVMESVLEGLGRLTSEVQLLRPAIDLRAGPDSGVLNGAAIDRFAYRVAALFSEEVLTRLDATPAELSPASTDRPEE
jgi:hypothetical protein